MKPAPFSFTIVKGVKFGPLIITCKDAAGEPVNLTGWSVFADARKNAKAAVAFSLEPEITTPASGEITLLFSDEASNALPSGSFRWDLVLESPQGERFGPFAAGSVTVSLINTRPA